MRATVGDGDAVIYLSIDSFLNNGTKEVKTVNAKTPAAQRKVYSTDYVFDSFGRMLQMTYPDGETLYYGYDNGGLLSAAWGEKRGNRYNYLNSLTYDEFGQRKNIAYGNGVKSSYSYDEKTRRLDKLVDRHGNFPVWRGSRQVNLPPPPPS